MSPSRKLWHDSPYDEHGMPMGCETVDYDNAEEVKKKMVQDKYVPEIPLNDPEYQPRQMSKTFTGQRPLTKKNFNTAITEGVGIPEEVETVDIEDPGVRRELIVREADEKGFSEVQELPKVEKQETVDEIGATDDNNPKQDEHKEAVEEENKEEEPSPDFLTLLRSADKEEDKDNGGTVQK